MAKLLKLRFLDPNEDNKNGVYTEVYCDKNDKRGYFIKLDKSAVNSNDTTVRVNGDKLYEARLLGVGWKSITKQEMERNLAVINKERVANGWEPITLPETNKEG